MRRILTTALALAALAAPTTVAAQNQISARGATLNFGGRLHAQYQASSVDSEASDFFIRRARFNGDWTFNDFVSGRIMAEFAGGHATLLDAYVRLDFDDAFQVGFGQLKRAFDRIELMSSTDLSTIERTGKIEGFSGCTGVGSICSYSRMSEALDLGNRDTGLAVQGQAGGFGYMATLTNGHPPGVRDDNVGKSVAGRVTWGFTDAFEIGANAQYKDFVDPDDLTDHVVVWGVDAEYGAWRDGLKLIGGVMGGGNWRALTEPTPGDFEAPNFLAGEVYGSYYFPLSSERIVGLEPLVRASFTDPNGDVDEDGGILLTPGFMAYFLGKNKVGANWDYYMPSTGDSEWSFKVQTFLYF